MTAFAAVLTRDGASPDPVAVLRTAAALAGVYGTPAPSVTAPGCVLLSASLHPDRPADPFVDRETGIAAAGQVLLEDSSSLAHALSRSRGASALELVAAAYSHWGERCTTRLSGEFAFVLWDPRARVLVSARDGLGIRRLYAAQGSRSIIVTNTIAAAIAAPDFSDAVDELALIEFLAYGAPQEGRTAFRAVRIVAPGHTLCLRDGIQNVSLTRHWWFPQVDGRRPRRSRHDVVDGYRAVLAGAAADRLGTASASILMSGGVDSTTIAAAARSVSPDTSLRAFTAVYDRLPSRDEIDHARQAASWLNIPLTPVGGDGFEALDSLWRGAATPEPIDEPTLSDWRLLVATAARHSTVALYGEDGDSLFLPPGLAELGRTMSIAEIGMAVARHVVSRRTLPYLGLRVKERLGLEARRPPAALPPFLSAAARDLLKGGEPPTVFGRTAQLLPPHRTRARTQARLCEGAARFLAPLIAAEFTQAPIEIRCPLLDTRVIRFVMELPPIPWCQQKHLPRVAYRGALPDAVLQRPKRGVPGLHEVLVASWREKTSRERRLRDSAAATWIDVPAWQRALDVAGPDESGIAWRVLQLDAWLTRRREIGRAHHTLCTA